MLVDHNHKGPPSSPSTSFHVVRWNLPLPELIKINFDGSLLNSAAAAGYLFRDWTGRLLRAGAASYGHTSVLVAKARALRDGITTAIQASFNKLCTEGDNLLVIQVLKGDAHVP